MNIARSQIKFSQENLFCFQVEIASTTNGSEYENQGNDSSYVVFFFLKIHNQR